MPFMRSCSKKFATQLSRKIPRFNILWLTDCSDLILRHTGETQSVSLLSNIYCFDGWLTDTSGNEIKAIWSWQLATITRNWQHRHSQPHWLLLSTGAYTMSQMGRWTVAGFFRQSCHLNVGKNNIQYSASLSLCHNLSHIHYSLREQLQVQTSQSKIVCFKIRQA